ncbi:GtrA family protein [Methylomonas sp. MgM2]
MVMFARFLLVGGLGFIIDAGITQLLVYSNIAPWLARFPAIGLAMIFTWLANRYFTYKVDKPRSANEAMRYGIVATAMALLNYLFYLFLVQKEVVPILAVTIATACQTSLSYYAYQYLVFMKPYSNQSVIILIINWFRSDIVNHFLLISGIAVGCVLLVRGIADPWVGLGDGDGALFSAIARNYLKFGIFELKFGQLINFEDIEPMQGVYYLHHPPLVPILTSVMFYLFGETEAIARLVSVLATLATGYILFFLVKKSTNTQLGMLSVFFFITYPSTIFFGRKPGYEAVTLFFLVLITFIYKEYKDNNKMSTLICLGISIIFGTASDWAAYFLPCALLIDHVVAQKHDKIDWQLVFVILVSPLVTLFSFLFSIYLVDKESVNDLLNQGLAYMGAFTHNGEIAKTIKEAKVSFSLVEYFYRLINNVDICFGIISILLSLLGWSFLKKEQTVTGTILIIFFSAFCPLLIFWRSLYMHIWWLHLVSVPLAIFSAIAIDSIIKLAEDNIEYDGVKIKRSIIISICLVVSVTTIHNYISLSRLQERLLPEGNHEKPSFIKETGSFIYKNTVVGSQILTNLNQNDRLLQYYSRRKINFDIKFKNEIETFVSLNNQELINSIYFMFYSAHNQSPDEAALNYYLGNHELVKSLSIDKNLFYLFKIR